MSAGLATQVPSPTPDSEVLVQPTSRTTLWSLCPSFSRQPLSVSEDYNYIAILYVEAEQTSLEPPTRSFISNL